MQLLIRYDKPSYITFPFVIKKGTKDMPDEMGQIKLLGGYNQVEEADWKRIVNHPIVKHCLEEEIIQVVEKSDSVNTIAAMTQVKALKVVRETNDIEVLKDWAKTDLRPAVRNAIMSHLEVLVLPDRRAAKGIDSSLTEETQPRRASNKVRTKVKASAEPEFSDDDDGDGDPLPKNIPTSVTKAAAMSKLGTKTPTKGKKR